MDVTTSLNEAAAAAPTDIRSEATDASSTGPAHPRAILAIILVSYFLIGMAPTVLDDVLAGRFNPGLVFDFTTDLDHVADAYAAMDERRAIKSLLTVSQP